MVSLRSRVLFALWVPEEHRSVYICIIHVSSYNIQDVRKCVSRNSIPQKSLGSIHSQSHKTETLVIK